jgi:hypothetical protein
VPAIVLPAFAPDPRIVSLPSVQLEAEPEASEGAVEPEEEPVSVLLDRIAAYTHGSAAAVS